mmetsp:Transcript_10094/g.34806  ORF Transcript_10094/g.34806 Transcript_10094/m.34806 type:complete len:356 (-) Transcript_10094:3034-4101(-)
MVVVGVHVRKVQPVEVPLDVLEVVHEAARLAELGQRPQEAHEARRLEVHEAHGAVALARGRRDVEARARVGRHDEAHGLGQPGHAQGAVPVAALEAVAHEHRVRDAVRVARDELAAAHCPDDDAPPQRAVGVLDEDHGDAPDGVFVGEGGTVLPMPEPQKVDLDDKVRRRGRGIGPPDRHVAERGVDADLAGRAREQHAALDQDLAAGDQREQHVRDEKRPAAGGSHARDHHRLVERRRRPARAREVEELGLLEARDRGEAEDLRGLEARAPPVRVGDDDQGRALPRVRDDEELVVVDERHAARVDHLEGRGGVGKGGARRGDRGRQRRRGAERAGDPRQLRGVLVAHAHDHPRL